MTDARPDDQPWTLYVGGPYDGTLIRDDAPTAKTVRPFLRDPDTNQLRKTAARYFRQRLNTPAGICYVYRWPLLTEAGFLASLEGIANARKNDAS